MQWLKCDSNKDGDISQTVNKTSPILVLVARHFPMRQIPCLPAFLQNTTAYQYVKSLDELGFHVGFGEKNFVVYKWLSADDWCGDSEFSFD